MIAGVQIIGIVFFAIMLYFTYVNYKRKNYGYRSLVLWGVIWLGGIFLVSFPVTIYGLMETLKIERTADFFTLSGFAFFSVVIFYMYSVIKKTNDKVELLVRRLAFEKKKK